MFPKIFLTFLVFAFPASTSEKVILCLGDSLTAGYQIPIEKAWPHLIEEEMSSKGSHVKVVNGGISGSTTSSALGRFNWHLKGQGPPDILILALGANDGLRGQSTDAMKKNLSSIIDLALKHKTQVLLAGMKMPPNYGKDYTHDFEKVFLDLAQTKKISFLPFLLEGVAAIPKLNLTDGIHPNPAGHQIMAGAILKHLLPLIKP